MFTRKTEANKNKQKFCLNKFLPFIGTKLKKIRTYDQNTS